MAALRTATVSRKTNETDIHITLTMDCAGAQAIEIDSGIGFLDHVRPPWCPNLNLPVARFKAPLSNLLKLTMELILVTLFFFIVFYAVRCIF